MTCNEILFFLPIYLECKTDSSLKLLSVFISQNESLQKYVCCSLAKFHWFWHRQKNTPELQPFNNASGLIR